MNSRSRRVTSRNAACTYQQSAVVVKLSEQHAAVAEEVSRADVAVKVTHVGMQPSVQLSVDVKLPGIGRLLDLQ